jgi:lysophospholipase L1-like esterase
MNDLDVILRGLEEGVRKRFVAFGSSNTERRIHGLHWFDWLDLGLKQTYGRVHHFINAGLGGDTTEGLITRFDDDVAFYKPDVVFITIGGNDSNPESGINASKYHHHLINILNLIRQINSIPILQTYYAADIPHLDKEHGYRFLKYMDIIRAAADETQVMLVDHHKRWELLRMVDSDMYQKLMLDALHVTPLGNMIIGLDLIRLFKAHLTEAQVKWCREGIRYQKFMDKLIQTMK